MPASPLVSVLIPAYNAEPWLDESLDSVAAQTYPNVEVILVDDGSTDRTLDIAKARENAAFKVFTQPNAGLSPTQNRAFDESVGELIQYLDADDLLDPDKVRLQVERLADEPEGTMASGPWTRFTDTIRNVEFVTDDGWRDFTPALGWFLAGWPQPLMFPSFAWLTPRTVIERAGPWHERLQLNRDGEFFARVVAEAHSIAFVDGAKSYYRSGVSGSLSQRKDRPAMESLFESYRIREAVIRHHDDSVTARRACAAAWQMFVYTAYPSVPELVRIAERRIEALAGEVPWQVSSGRLYNHVRDALGWKTAAQLQRAYYAVRYRGTR